MQGDRIDELRSDHISGSLEILRKAAEVLKERSDTETIDKVRSTHPDMAALHHLCDRVITSKNPHEAIEQLLESIEKSPEIIGNKLLPFIKDQAVIMTYSRSSTVKKTLFHLQNKGKMFRMRVAESRPGYEGRTLAQELGAKGIDSTLMTDAAALSFLPKIDVLIVGADRVTPSVFVNKVGTYPFVQLAHLHDIPCYLLADQTKMVNDWPWKTDLKEHDPREVWAQNMPGVHIVNPYFEEIPLDLVSLISND